MERHITLNYLTNLRDHLTTNPIPTTLVLISTLTNTYLIWTLTYNLTLHPLSPIPGPLLARTSTLWTCYHDFFLRGKLPFALISAHQKYGLILRITPNEVHISDPEFLDTIFALRNRNAPELVGDATVELLIDPRELKGLAFPCELRLPNLFVADRS